MFRKKCVDFFPSLYHLTLHLIGAPLVFSWWILLISFPVFWIKVRSSGDSMLMSLCSSRWNRRDPSSFNFPSLLFFIAEYLMFIKSFILSQSNIFLTSYFFWWKRSTSERLTVSHLMKWAVVHETFYDVRNIFDCDKMNLISFTPIRWTLSVEYLMVSPLI